MRLKSARTRGGGIKDVLYANLTGAADVAVQISLQYEKDEPPTNASATPVIRDVAVRDLAVTVDDREKDAYLSCLGLDDSEITGVSFENVRVTGSGREECGHCAGASYGSSPDPCFL